MGGKSKRARSAVSFELRTHLIVALVNPAVSNEMASETNALSGTVWPL
jgi:hypothetical protein